MAERDCWEVIDEILPRPEASRVLLYGVPGTGKTYQATKAGLAPGEPVLSVTLTRDAMAAELRGVYLPSGGSGMWEFHDGAAVTAMRHSEHGPVRLVLNELDRSSEDALSFLLSVLDDAQVAAETLPTGETVTSGPGLKVIGTINGEPQALPDALRDRFAVQIRIDKPHPAAIAALPEDLQDAARGTIGHDDEARRCSVRAWYAFASLRQAVGAELASAAVFGSRAATVLDSLKVAQMAAPRSQSIPTVPGWDCDWDCDGCGVAFCAPRPGDSLCAQCREARANAAAAAMAGSGIAIYLCPDCGIGHGSAGLCPDCKAKASTNMGHGGGYVCDFCHQSVEPQTAIGKARHSRYCKANPKNGGAS